PFQASGWRVTAQILSGVSLEHPTRDLEGLVERGDEVLPAELVQLSGPFERLERLGANPGDQEADSLAREGPKEVVQHPDSRGVHDGNVPHSEDEYAGLASHQMEDVLDLVG